MAPHRYPDVDGTAVDVAALRRRRHEDQQRNVRWPRPSQHDELTGLPDHRYLDLLADRTRFRLLPGRPVAYVRVDVDDTEGISRRCGMLVGNGVIRGVGGIIAQATADRGRALRTGHDEFLVILPGCALEEAWIWAEDLRTRVERLQYGAGGTDEDVTTSIGVLSTVSERVDPDLVELADGAVELARHEGGNCVCTWDWVEIDSLLRQVTRRPELDVEAARSAFIDACEYLLGPTQRHHVTVHCEEVSKLAGRLARHLSGASRQNLVATATQAGLLHDLGKCVIPERLLAKPASLSLQEWSLMGRHAEIGARMAARLGADDAVVQSIMHHHARYDSDAMSRGLVPQGARILCVADALVTMSNPRSYALTRTAPDALNELAAESGRQFDPAVVAAALRCGTEILTKAA